MIWHWGFVCSRASVSHKAVMKAEWRPFWWDRLKREHILLIRASHRCITDWSVSTSENYSREPRSTQLTATPFVRTVLTRSFQRSLEDGSINLHGTNRTAPIVVFAALFFPKIRLRKASGLATAESYVQLLPSKKPKYSPTSLAGCWEPLLACLISLPDSGTRWITV